MSNVNKKDIAVIGMSCRFAGADTIEEFWSHLRAGDEMIHFYTPEELKAGNVPASQINDPAFIKARSVVADKTSFDFSFFGYTRDEAALMDPQIRIFHEEVWHALEDAGYDPYVYTGKIGLFAGASDHLNWLANAMISGMGSQVDPFYAGLLANKHFLPTLIAYKLNLRGPAYYINTACSTSLTAIHMACRNLLMQECNMAVAGAVRIDSSQSAGYHYQQGMIYSADGHCRTFDAASSGTISGEGAGIVVLKRLEDALRDNDRIYAVVKSSAVNNDGNRKVGYTAPSPEGQAECIRLAHRLAGIGAETVGYLEAHGTATQLGDPVEILALNEAFGHNKEKHCAIGAVKSNMGHLDTAAGMAGFIKTVLSLYHKELPPSLHFNQPNPAIDFDGGPFYVNKTLQSWQRFADTPLRAGVSAFGIGGTNAHIVLEEASAIVQRLTVPEEYKLLVCSAKTPGALERQVQALQSVLEAKKGSLEDIAFSLRLRHHFRYRKSVTARTREEGLAALLDYTPDVLPAPKRTRLIFMFPGQGAQYLNMGRDLYTQLPVFKKWIDEGCTLLEKATGENYLELLYPAHGTSADATHLNHTRYTQPLLFVFEYALYQQLDHWGIHPDQMIGHSLGELVAACCSGVFSFSDGIKMVLQRAALMAQQPGGVMLGINHSASLIKPLLGNETDLAAVNGPTYCVASGTEKGIAALTVSLQQQGVSATRLRTSHAFHSFMMEPAVKAFSDQVSTIKLSAATIPFISNISGQVAGTEVTDPAYWGKHIRETVNFFAGINTLSSAGNDAIYLEVGPGNTLSNFCKHTGAPVVNLLRHPQEQKDDTGYLLTRIGKLWEQGVEICWKNFSAGAKVGLPGYSFDKHDFPAAADLRMLLQQYIQQDKKVPIEEWFYIPGWKRGILPQKQTALPQEVILFSDESVFASQLKQYLTGKGHVVKEVLKGNTFPPAETSSCIIYLWDLQSATVAEECFNTLLQISKIFEKSIYYITDRLYPIMDEGQGTSSTAATAAGLIKVLAQETPLLSFLHLDISLEEDPVITLASIYKELISVPESSLVALRRQQRWIRQYEKVATTAVNTVVKKNGTYIITGGLGNVGITLAEHLLTQYDATVHLIGRTVLTTPDNKWNELKRLESLSGKVIYHAADVADIHQLSTLTGQLGEINGVIHAAGNVNPLSFKPVLFTDTCAEHFDPKIKGLLNIYTLFKDRQLDFVWITSSLSAVLGGLTYSTYTAANLFMDHFVAAHHMGNWVTVDLDGIGDNRITKEELVNVFERSFSLKGFPNLVVSVSPLQERIDKYSIAQPVVTPLQKKSIIKKEFVLTPVEEEMLQLWQSFFGQEDLGPDDDFFDLGGDSLKAMTLTGKIHRVFHVQLPVETIFKHPDVRSLSTEVEIAIGMQQLPTVAVSSKNIKELTI
ncbi:acyltransferase domain-containing protein [Chitinophaga oryziterrae]|uniref:Acyltransferase domain-containing protein n=1 Tax=Chitinophaga oryziterrae TaxID=1031224 RepID=A0A6N8JAS5_9BACT|nr:type I polyketide synthase [Chitinophaga oryziterrae]MVT42253.1 acyltransferase domain-containing protein [Chitinophaga oryziterrae]